MEEKEYNPIYARTDENGIVTKFFSTAFEQPTENDVVIKSDNTDRHGANRYQVFDDNGLYNYEIVDGKLTERDKTADLKELEKSKLRQLRETECFPIINRGQLWYDTLTDEQKTELNEWYTAWLNAPQTKQIPNKPSWLTDSGEVLKV